MSQPKTAAEYVAQFDAGGTMITISMGGLGPGYEQTIQLLVVELLRDNLGKPLPTDEEWRRWGDDTIAKHDEALGGLSGAQAGVAKQLAHAFLRDGIENTLAKVGLDRHICFSKFWPRTADPERAA